MTATEAKIVSHYTNGALLDAIRAGWAKLKTTSDERAIDQLAGVDEFHIGGRIATELVCSHLDLAPGMRVLDVGCGLGGAARFMAATFGAKVEGVDLTPEYVAVGNQLSQEVGLADSVALVEGNALALPKDDGLYDRVTMFHVGMNIPDKERLFSEMARVLKPGGVLAAYDVMRVGDPPVDYPVPWAQDETTSFVEPVAHYRAAIERAGLTVATESRQKDLGLEFFARMKARVAESGPPPLGLHLVMGKDAGVKAANMAGNIAKDAIAPVLLTARKG